MQSLIPTRRQFINLQSVVATALSRPAIAEGRAGASTERGGYSAYEIVHKPRSLQKFVHHPLVVGSLVGTVTLFLLLRELSATDFNIGAGDVAGLQAAITASNSNNADDNIFLATGSTYTLTVPNNGTNGLPIVQGDNGHLLHISGNGSNVSRSTAGGTPNFRILAVASGANLTLDRLTISNGHLNTGSGGGISNSGTLALTGCVITQNDINGITESDNASGGGINSTGTLSVINTTVSFNGAIATQFARGGGISSTGALTIIGSTFKVNGVSSPGIGNGGGIYNRGPLILTNSTISGNSAAGPGVGAGLYHQPSSGAATAALTNDTIVNNNAGSSGEAGGIADFASGGVGAMSFLNTIVAQNTAGTGPDISAGAGAINSLGHNLIQNTSANSGWIASDLLGADPLIEPLQNNGGPTETHALIRGTFTVSPAIDAADDSVLSPPLSLTTDQRGFPRKMGSHVDIGAYEFDPPQRGPTFTVNTIVDHDDGDCTAFDCSLREAINALDDVLVSSVVTFAPNVRGTIELTAALPEVDPVASWEIAGPGANLLTIHRRVSTQFAIFTVSNAAFGRTAKISGLTVSGGAGGIVNKSSNLAVTRCVISDNSASNAAGIFNDGSGSSMFPATLTVDSCTLRNNNATNFGGALFNSGASNGQATMTLINCTIADNNAGSRGAAIHNTGSGGVGTVSILNCTFSNNSAPLGGIFNTNGGSGTATVTTRNSIFKTGSSGSNFSTSSGGVISQGHNLSNDAAGGDAGTGPGGLLNQTGDVRNTNPMLNANGLQNNGGPTPTIALLIGSPASNTGDDAFAPSADQRGFLRNGVSDKGAFESFGIIAPSSAVSRKTHGAAGMFDADLPLSGSAGIECRSGGATNDHQLVVTFGTSITVNGSPQAQVTAGTGQIGTGGIPNGGEVTVDAGVVTVPLTNVTNAQMITVTLFGVNSGPSTNNVSIPLRMLLGDTTGNGTVNASDVSQTKSRSGQAVDATNFRSDVTVSGSINASDVGLVKSRSGTSLP
jgi:CSLREA domain-containing protein